MAVRHIRIEVAECTCERCGAKWVPRPVLKDGKWVTELPIPCTVCKSAYWDRPRTNKIPKHLLAKKRAGGNTITEEGGTEK